ncbi:protein CREG1-like [Teleopsis dalmanni]|uniref:protein CREG1-like n=1 Tax=Teleopsis dalmanni TaxID=139649 RepID=UPI0018CCD469|nr:protein CREG1-like [Teleopsis dalmanni]XP_037951098.1 protein CREG1-like [Teleopsis dalmanni]
MSNKTTFTTLLLLIAIAIDLTYCYSALEDSRLISEYRKQLRDTSKYAKVARTLVHDADWASVGTISTDNNTLDYPTVNVISTDDNDINGKSTGRIHFLLTDLDFTGKDWKHDNKVSFLYTENQTGKCKARGVDPMEPTCARTLITGKVVEMDKNSNEYVNALTAFKQRHPSATKWMKTHTFYICELNIRNIYVLNFYGGPHNVPVEAYYSAVLNY